MAEDKCWAVSSGSYSDYSVTAVFPTKDLAESFAKQMNHRRPDPLDRDDYFVEEFSYFTELPEIYSVYTVFGYVGAAGEVAFGEPYVSREYGPRTRSSRPRLGFDGLDRPHGNRQISFIGEDLEACRKAAADRIAQWKVEHGHV
jgi:hypothetical protein